MQNSSVCTGKNCLIFKKYNQFILSHFVHSHDSFELHLDYDVIMCQMPFTFWHNHKYINYESGKASGSERNQLS